MKLFSFPPISNPQSHILILGTMPGNDSLKYNEYYAHPQNAFWKIMFTLFNRQNADDYITKQSLLLDNKIALWDTLKACKREGSLDSNIIEEEPNNITSFLKKHSQIKHLYFNGKKSYDYFIKYTPGADLPYSILPSTSPAHAIPFEKKLSKWASIKQYL